MDASDPRCKETGNRKDAHCIKPCQRSCVTTDFICGDSAYMPIMSLHVRAERSCAGAFVRERVRVCANEGRKAFGAKRERARAGDALHADVDWSFMCATPASAPRSSKVPRMSETHRHARGYAAAPRDLSAVAVSSGAGGSRRSPCGRRDLHRSLLSYCFSRGGDKSRSSSSSRRSGIAPGTKLARETCKARGVQPRKDAKALCINLFGVSRREVSRGSRAVVER
eukprot:4729044-Pleurochrysis_carterae.AAC.5